MPRRTALRRDGCLAKFALLYFSLKVDSVIASVPSLPVMVGSGVTEENLAEVMLTPEKTLIHCETPSPVLQCCCFDNRVPLQSRRRLGGWP